MFGWQRRGKPIEYEIIKIGNVDLLVENRYRFGSISDENHYSIKVGNALEKAAPEIIEEVISAVKKEEWTVGSSDEIDSSDGTARYANVVLLGGPSSVKEVVAQLQLHSDGIKERAKLIPRKLSIPEAIVELKALLIRAVSDVKAIDREMVSIERHIKLKGLNMGRFVRESLVELKLDAAGIESAQEILSRANIDIAPPSARR